MVKVAAPTGLGRVLVLLVERRVPAVRTFLAVLAAKSAALCKNSFGASVRLFHFVPWVCEPIGLFY